MIFDKVFHHQHQEHCWSKLIQWLFLFTSLFQHIIILSIKIGITRNSNRFPFLLFLACWTIFDTNLTIQNKKNATTTNNWRQAQLIFSRWTEEMLHWMYLSVRSLYLSCVYSLLIYSPPFFALVKSYLVSRGRGWNDGKSFAHIFESITSLIIISIFMACSFWSIQLDSSFCWSMIDEVFLSCYLLVV